MAQSKAFSWNREDTMAFLKNAAIFLIPTAIVLVGSIIEIVPADWQYAAIAIWILNRILDALRRYVSGR